MAAAISAADSSFVGKRLISLATAASVGATSFALAWDPTEAHHIRGAMPIQYLADQSNGSEEQPFLSENEAAMKKMMADMTIKPTSDVDRDFVAMMVPHPPRGRSLPTPRPGRKAQP